VSLVCQSGAHIAGGEPPSAAEGAPVGIFGLKGLAAKVEGIAVRVQKFQEPECI
jgi:hypothetical protein